MCHAHEDEGADDDVERGVAGNQNQDALGVGCQPDVILADEELQWGEGGVGSYVNSANM